MHQDTPQPTAYYSFQPVGPLMGSPFTDVGTEGCVVL